MSRDMTYSKARQSGFVSIIAASILMIILTLVTIGFSRVMQREQRQALDRQLSSQAFYAAETAVNDVYDYIQTHGAAPRKDTCDVSGWNNGLISTADTEVSYTCLEINPTPSDLVFTNSINTESSKVMPIETADGSTVESVTFSWNGPIGSLDVDGSNNVCTNNPTLLPPSFATNAIPLLRVDLVAVPRGSTLTRDGLVNSSATAYLYPKTCGDVGRSTAIADITAGLPNNTGRVIDVNCAPGANCEYTINNMTANRYYVRIKSLYNNVETLRITATSSSGPFQFTGAQTLVDATGKANDVLRRIEARLSNNPDYPLPEYVVQGIDGVCKRMQYSPPSFVQYANPYASTVCDSSPAIIGASNPGVLGSTITQACHDVRMAPDTFGPGVHYHRFPRSSPTELGVEVDQFPDTRWASSIEQLVSEDPATGAVTPTTLPPGRYRVWLFSWDLHTVPNGQDNETYRIELRNSNGTNLLTQSGVISDLPNPPGQRYQGGMYKIEEVNTLANPLVLTDTATHINAIHGPTLLAADPLDGTPNNSIRAVCASFEYIDNGGTGGNGDSNVSGGGNSGGGSSSGTDIYVRVNSTNNSVNNPAIVAGCRWDYGDGTIYTDSNCYNGNIQSHRYFGGVIPADPCAAETLFTITLTMFFEPSTGFPPEVSSYQKTVPHGPGMNACP